MNSFIIKQGVLNDDTLYVAGKGKVFKGKYVAILKYYTFETSWCDRENVKRFKTLEKAIRFIKKRYNTVDVVSEIER